MSKGQTVTIDGTTYPAGADNTIDITDLVTKVDAAELTLEYSGAAGDDTNKLGDSGLTWTLESGKLTISGTGAIPDYTYDEGNDKYDSPFFGDSDITEIVINDGVTKIGEGTFYACENLTSITIPDSVTSIGDYAFAVTGLTSITIPASVTSIGEYVFSQCSNLKTVTFAENSKVTSIGDSAFNACEGLTNIEIPASVESIGEDVFFQCSNLKTVTFAENSKVTSIGDSAFDSCTGLTSITIPDSVTSIGEFAFQDCSNLATVTFAENSKVTTIGKSAFHNCASLTSITIPSSVTSIGNSAFDSCESLTSVTILDGVTKIGECVFYNCTGLTSVTIPNSVTSIGAYAFQCCEKLTTVTIPSSVTTISTEAFGNCANLTSVTIPSSVTSISTDTFQSCNKDLKVTVALSQGQTVKIGDKTYTTEDNDITSLVTKEDATTLTLEYLGGGGGDPAGSDEGYSLTLPDGITASGTTTEVDGKTLYKGEVTLNVGKGAAIGNVTGISDTAADANGQIKFTLSADVKITKANLYYSVTAPAGVKNISGTKITIDSVDYYKNGSTLTLTAKTGYSVKSSVKVSEDTTITPTLDTKKHYVFGTEGNYTLATAENVASNNYPDLTQVYEVTLPDGVNVKSGTYVKDDDKTYAAGEITLESTRTGYTVKTPVTVSKNTTLALAFDTENHYVFGTEGDYTLATAKNVKTKKYPDLTQVYELTLPDNVIASGDVYLTVDEVAYVKQNSKITLQAAENYSIGEIDGATPNGDGTYSLTVNEDTEVNASVIMLVEFNKNKTAANLLEPFSGTFSAEKYKNLTRIDASENKTNLTIIGNDKNSAITGGSGNDTITGGGKNDTLDGDAGNDSLTGGEGKDIFVFSGGNDTIADYVSKDDKISVDNDFTSYSISGKDVVLNYEEEDSLTIKDGVGEEINFVGGEKIVFTADGIFNSKETGVTVMSSAGATFDDSYKKLKTIYDGIGTTITGNSENNNIYASENGSTLNGGGGKDTLNGGDKADVFVHDGGDKKNITMIKNYSMTEGSEDTIKLSNVKNLTEDITKVTQKGKTLTLELADESKVVVNYSETPASPAEVKLNYGNTTETVKFGTNAIYGTGTVTLMSAYKGKFEVSDSDKTGYNITGAAVTDKKNKLNIIGGGGADTIQGGNGVKGNTLRGGANDDSLVGTANTADTFYFSKDDSGNDTVADFEYLKDTIKIDKGLINEDDPINISGSTVKFNLDGGSLTVDTKTSENKILFKSGKTLYWWDDDAPLKGQELEKGTGAFVTATNKDSKSVLSQILKDYKKGTNSGFCVVNLDANIKNLIADKAFCKAAVFTSSGPQK